MNILLCISYDGTNYFGFQRQKKAASIQLEIEKALEKIYNRAVAVTGGARTDAGVHAEKTFVNFHIEKTSIPAEKLGYVLNSKLPDDIAVLYSQQVDEKFHARYSAIARTYYYQFYKGSVIPSVYRLYSLAVDSNLDFNMINKELQELQGCNDFSSFTVRHKEQGTMIRTLFDIYMKNINEKIMRIYIRGNAFLWKMIRCIIGTLLKRAIDRKLSKPILHSIKEILEARDNRLTGSIAEARGLCLCNIEYEPGAA